jgi:hypothetical protein
VRPRRGISDRPDWAPLPEGSERPVVGKVPGKARDGAASRARSGCHRHRVPDLGQLRGPHERGHWSSAEVVEGCHGAARNGPDSAERHCDDNDQNRQVRLVVDDDPRFGL